MSDGDAPAVPEDVRAQVQAFAASLQEDFAVMGADARAKATRYADGVADIAADVAAGQMNVTTAELALEAISSGLKSDAISAGYEAKARTVAAVQNGVLLALKLLVTAVA